MYIKAKLRLNALILSVAMIFITLFFLWSYRDASKADQSIALARELRSTAFEGTILRHEHLLYGEARSWVQLNKKNEHFVSLLKQARESFTQAEETWLLESIRKDFERIIFLFAKAIEDREHENKLPGSSLSFAEGKKRLLGQVLLTSYSIIDNINSLLLPAQKTSAYSHQRFNFLVFIFMGMAVIVAISNSMFVNNLLTKRIKQLSQRAEIIGSGHLEDRISTDGSDEFSMLAKTLNTMADKMKTSYTTVENLEREIEFRKQAENEVQEKTNDYRFLFENMLEGYAYCKMIFEDGQPQDVEYLAVNSSFERLSGFKDVVGKRVSEVMPGLKESAGELFEIYGRVASTGKSETFEYYVEPFGLWYSISAYSSKQGYFIAVFENITKRKQAETEQGVKINLLNLCNQSSDLKDLTQNLIIYFQKYTGCDAVGVRLRKGNDFPYYETRGFPEEFVLAENSLCVLDQKGEMIRDSNGNPVIACMCGNILCGRFDPAKPFFTARGSFWSNCTTDLLAGTTEADRQCRTRNRCNGEGYESVALIPLHVNQETYGLFQFNDKHRDLFTAEKIASLEELVNYVAIALAKMKTEEALKESYQFNQQVIQSAGEGIIVYGPDLRYQGWNSFMERLSGFRAKEVVGKHPREIFPFLLETGVFTNVELALAGESPLPLDFSYSSPRTGQLVWVSNTYAPLRNIRGEIIGVIGTSRDIAAQKKSQDALRASGEKYRVLFEQSLDAIYLSTPGGILMEANPSFYELLGYLPEELIGNSIAMLFSPPPDDAGFEQAMEKDGFVSDLEIKMRKSTGEVIDCHLNTILLRDKEGKVIASQGIIRDISERKRAENEMMVLQAQLRQSQKMEAIGTLAGGIAHDFNNILGAIFGYTEIAKLNLPEKDRKNINYLNQVLTAANRAKDLVSQILTFSRQSESERKPLSLNAVIKETVKLLRASLPATIEIRQNSQAQSDTILGNHTQIHQVLMNLSTNAFHAMQNKGGILEVSLMADYFDKIDRYPYPEIKPGSYLKLTVRDTGVGMSQEILERVFDPFFTTKASGEGTGLGLSVVYGIIKYHEGVITVQSLPGLGTSFDILLPVHYEEIQIGLERNNLELPKGAGQRILFVDDEAMLADIGGKILKHLNYMVFTQTSSLEALRVFREKPHYFDLIITDYTMPGMIGTELARQIKLIRPDIPVIICSGFSDAMNQEETNRVGIQGILMKPLTLSEMAKTIYRALSTSLSQ